MAETDPIIVGFGADTTDLETGTASARHAIRGVGDEAETSNRKFKLFSDRGLNLLSTMLALRGAIAITTDVLKSFGLQSAEAEKFTNALSLAMNVGIAVLAVYKAATLAKAAVDFFAAKGAFLLAIANVSAATFFTGTAFAIGLALATWIAISTLNVPRAQFGGIVSPHPGGTLVRVGEAGSPEAIVPLNDRNRGLSGIRIDTINLNVSTNNPDEVMEVLARRIQRLKAAGF